jgi:glycerate kinase
MAEASGLGKVDRRGSASATEASTRGTGELIVRALDEGYQRLIIGCGGSATTDGGAGALAVVGDRLHNVDVEVMVAVDVSTVFLDAARVFGPQKGATPEDVIVLTERLERLARWYATRYGIDIRDLIGGGAAGGLAGGLATLGAKIKLGVDVVADHVGLGSLISQASLLVTGEGCVDRSSGTGKVVGALVLRAQQARVPVLIVAGQVRSAPPELRLGDGLELLNLVDHFGESEAFQRTVERVGDLVVGSRSVARIRGDSSV